MNIVQSNYFWPALFPLIIVHAISHLFFLQYIYIYKFQFENIFDLSEFLRKYSIEYFAAILFATKQKTKPVKYYE